jgi:hypothetical protein
MARRWARSISSWVMLTRFLAAIMHEGGGAGVF